MSSSSINDQPEKIPTGTTQSGAAEQTNNGFVRSVGLPTAVAINMTQMCGIGPFITIPLMVVAFGGPQAILGWIANQLSLTLLELSPRYDTDTAILRY